MSGSPKSENVTTNGRDCQGKFTAGNRGGPGNPFARQVAGLRKAFIDTIKAEDIAAIAAAMIERARAGDVAAAKLVLAYGIGKPQPAGDPDRLDVNEWQNFKDTAGMVKELPELVQTPEPEMSLSVVRATRPAMTGEMAGLLGATLGVSGQRLAPSPIGSNGNRKGKRKRKHERKVPSTNGRNGHAVLA
jgi:hypothetical protein